MSKHENVIMILETIELLRNDFKKSMNNEDTKKSNEIFGSLLAMYSQIDTRELIDALEIADVKKIAA